MAQTCPRVCWSPEQGRVLAPQSYPQASPSSPCFPAKEGRGQKESSPQHIKLSFLLRSFLTLHRKVDGKKKKQNTIIILCIYQQTTRQQLPKSGLHFIRQVLWECNGFYDRYPFILSVLCHRLFENTRKMMLGIPYPKETRPEKGDLSIYSHIFNRVFTERRKDALNL